MTQRTTERGFAIYDELTDRYGSKIRVQKSSIITEPCVWIFCEGMGIHLTAEQAERIRAALGDFIAEHEPSVIVTDNDGEPD